MIHPEKSLSDWFMKTALTSPDAEPIKIGADLLDVVSLADGRHVCAQFYGEAPLESVFIGTKGIVLTGHIHFEDDQTIESYLPTLDGPVLRVVIDKESATVLEDPTETSIEQQMAVVDLLDPYLFSPA